VSGKYRLGLEGGIVRLKYNREMMIAMTERFTKQDE